MMNAAMVSMAFSYFVIGMTTWHSIESKFNLPSISDNLS